jgi:hypothetical protein
LYLNQSEVEEGIILLQLHSNVGELAIFLEKKPWWCQSVLEEEENAWSRAIIIREFHEQRAFYEG